MSPPSSESTGIKRTNKDDAPLSTHSLMTAQTDRSNALMDIGINCAYCRQLDFLPFTCYECKLVFCENHRAREAHACAVPIESAGHHIPPRTTPRNHEPVLLLFPDRAANMRVVDEKLAQANRAAGRRLGGGSSSATPRKRRALEKFTRFLTLQREKRELAKPKLLFSSLLNKGKSSVKADDTSAAAFQKPSASSTLQLRKLAKGDQKVALADRIYLWCVYVPSSKANGANEEDEAFRLDIESIKKPVFILKNWPVGRALDSVADTLLISNINNGTLDADEKLHVCRVGDNMEPVIVKTSDRCALAFKNGQLIYLVRGLI